MFQHSIIHTHSYIEKKRVSYDQGVSQEIELIQGNKVNVTTDEAYKEACDGENIYIDYKNIVGIMNVGKRIYIDDGNMSLIVLEKGK